MTSPNDEPLLDQAKIFKSCKCDLCGETAGEYWMHLMGGKRVCRDCFKRYDRFGL